MSRTLAVAFVVFLLQSILLVTPAAGGNCTIAPDADACPFSLFGVCTASLGWFQQNEIDCKGKDHGAIMLKNNDQLWVGSLSLVSFQVDLTKFKEYKMVSPG